MYELFILLSIILPGAIYPELQVYYFLWNDSLNYSDKTIPTR